MRLSEMQGAGRVKDSHKRHTWDKVFKNGPSKVFKSSLPQILLGPFLNTLSCIYKHTKTKRRKHILGKCINTKCLVLTKTRALRGKVYLQHT